MTVIGRITDWLLAAVSMPRAAHPISHSPPYRPFRFTPPLPSGSTLESYQTWLAELGEDPTCPDMLDLYPHVLDMAGWGEPEGDEAGSENPTHEPISSPAPIVPTSGETSRHSFSEIECLADIRSQVARGCYLSGREYSHRWGISEGEVSKRIRAFREAELVGVQKIGQKRLVTWVKSHDATTETEPFPLLAAIASIRATDASREAGAHADLRRAA